jgi:hypothetical protein
MVEFYVSYPVCWRGNYYGTGNHQIPEDLAIALGWIPPSLSESQENPDTSVDGLENSKTTKVKVAK